MKIRNELNEELFRQKMDNFKRSEHSVKPVEFTAICNGDIDAVKMQITQGGVALIADDRIMSKNKLKNTVYHFVLLSSISAMNFNNAVYAAI